MGCHGRGVLREDISESDSGFTADRAIGLAGSSVVSIVDRAAMLASKARGAVSAREAPQTEAKERRDSTLLVFGGPSSRHQSLGEMRRVFLVSPIAMIATLALTVTPALAAQHPAFAFSTRFGGPGDGAGAQPPVWERRRRKRHHRAFILGGQVTLMPEAESSTLGNTGRLKTVVPVVPDAPIGNFRFTLFGGSQGYLSNNQNFCSAPLYPRSNSEAKTARP